MMKMEDALKIINGKNIKPGYMVSFERKEGSLLASDHFPDKHAGEPLIRTEKQAWAAARRFAEKTVGKCVNVYVIDSEFRPVSGYRERMIENRNSEKAKNSPTQAQEKAA